MTSLQAAPPTGLLLKQYVRIAQDLTDAANPQDNFLAAVLADARYERALRGLQLVAKHDVGKLVQTLIDWRRDVNEEIKRTCSQSNAVNLQGVCKRAAMEILFLEASTQVLVEFTLEFMADKQFMGFFESMQQVAFRWLLNAEEYVPHGELALIRQQVVLASTRVVGAMSRIRLSDITTQFIAKLVERVGVKKDVRSDNSVVRGQVLKLCQGMKGVCLRFSSDQQAQMSVDFLRRVHPLEHNAPVKKSQVHHALCEMLTEVLLPLIKANQPHASADTLPPATMMEWYNQVLRMKNEIGQWVNKHTKHIPAGYPLVTVLVCLVDDDNYVKLVDSMADFLVKQMKAKEYRSLCIKCLCQLVVSYIVRMCGSSKMHGQEQAWLDRVVKPLMANARKGGMTAGEQQDFVMEVLDLNPEYAVGTVVLDLLQAEQLDAQLIGLRCLYLACLTVPAATVSQGQAGRSRGRGSTPVPGFASSVAPALRSSGTAASGQQAAKRLVQWGPGDVLQLLQQGQHPFELLGISHLLPRLHQQLSTMLGSLHRTFATYTTYGSEAVPKDKAPQIQLLVWVLRLVPFLQPGSWQGAKPLELLPGYTAHVELQVRAAAVEALVSTLQGSPALRSTVLLQVVVFLSALPDEAQQTTRDCMSLLRTLITCWLTLLEQQQLAGGQLPPLLDGAGSPEPSWQAGPQWLNRGTTPGLDLHRIEGVVFALLCSYDPLVRQEALQLLSQARTLHQQLVAVGGAAAAASLQSVAASPSSKAGGGGGQLEEASSLRQQMTGKSAAIPEDQATPRGPGGPPSTPPAASPGGGTPTRSGAGGQKPLPPSGLGAAGSGLSPPSGVGLGMVAGAVDGLLSLAGNLVDSVASTGSSSSNLVTASIGLFTRHRGTASRDFGDLPSFGSLEVAGGQVTYLMDVLEEVGTKVARQCYWDFGDWSDLWKDINQVAPEVSLQSVLLATDDVGRLRWVRVLAELTQLLAPLCPLSMGVAYIEIMYKLGKYILRDSAGRLQLPPDNLEGRRSEAWKHYVVVACAAPPSLREGVERAGTRRVSTGLSIKDVIKLLMASLPQGPALLQQKLLLALGHASPEHYSLLVDELGGLVDEYARPGRSQRRQSRPDEVRVVVANLLRILCDCLGPTTLGSHPLLRGRVLEWIRETYLFLRSIPPFGEGFWEVSQVAYCLCSVVRNTAAQLVPALSSSLTSLKDGAGGSEGSSPMLAQVRSLKARSRDVTSGAAAAAGASMLRKQLFEMFAAWSVEGLDTGTEYASRLSNGMAAALARVKDLELDARDTLSHELQQSADCLDQVARMAMAALLQGPIFDSDARRAQGPVLFWIDRLLKSPGTVRVHSSASAHGNQGNSLANNAAARAAVARNGLFQLLRSNQDMINVCVDRCYDPDTRVASCYFQVVCEVYSLHPVRVEPHVLLSLVLYKLVDANPDIREDALHMLHTLSDREWQSSAVAPRGTPKSVVGAAPGGDSAWLLHLGGPGVGPGEPLDAGGEAGRALVVLGGLQDSYQQFQYQLSVKLARDHPEMSEALCEEVMTRQLEIADKVSQHPMLTGLAPWMENLSIAAHWSGTWCERLLKSMYYVTLRHGSELPQEIERLWSTLAANKRNIVPILDFLLNLGMHVAYQEMATMLEFLLVAKRITLYLARISPQQTIDALVAQLGWQLYEEEAGGSGLLGSAPQGEGCAGTDFLTQLQLAQAGEAADQGRGEQLTCWSPTLDMCNSSSSLWAFSMGPQGTGTPTLASAGMGSTASSASFRSSDLFEKGMRHMATGLSASADMTPRDGPGRSLTARSDSGTSRSSHGFMGGLAASMAGGSDGASGGAMSGLGLLSSSLPMLRTLGLGRSATGDDSGASPPLSASAGAGGAAVRRSGTSITSTGEVPVKNGTGMGLGLPLAKIPSYDPSSPALRALVSRPELALCLLSEVAYEHDEAFSAHLALLLHVAVVVADAEEPLVATHAQQLLVNLLYSLNAHAQEQGKQDPELVPGSKKADTLIRHLQSMRGRRLWEPDPLSPHQQLLLQQSPPSQHALTQLVTGLVSVLPCEVALTEAWSQVALDWLQATNRHFAFRSQQVLRALRPGMSQPMLSSLLCCLQHACSHALSPDSPCNSTALDTALELLATLCALVSALPPSRLVLFPSLLWVAVGLLGCNQVQLYCRGVQLLGGCLEQLQLGDPVVQNVLLAAAPVTDDGLLAPLLASLQPGGHRAAAAAGELPLPRPQKQQQQQPAGEGGEAWQPAAAHSRQQHGHTRSISQASSSGHSASSPISMAAAGQQQQASSELLPASQQQQVLARHKDSTWAAGLILPLESPRSPASSSSSSSAAPPVLLAAQQLLLRGLLLADTRVTTLSLLTQLAAQLAAHKHLLLPRLQRPDSPVTAAVVRQRPPRGAGSAAGLSLTRQTGSNTGRSTTGHTVQTLSGHTVSPGLVTPSAGSAWLQQSQSPAGSLREPGFEPRTTPSPVVRTAPNNRSSTGALSAFRTTADMVATPRHLFATGEAAGSIGSSSSAASSLRGRSSAAAAAAAGVAGEGSTTQDSSSEAAAAPAAAAVVPPAAVGASHRVSVDEEEGVLQNGSNASSSRSLQSKSQLPSQDAPTASTAEALPDVTTGAADWGRDAAGAAAQGDQGTPAAAAAAVSNGASTDPSSVSRSSSLNRKKLPPAPFNPSSQPDTDASQPPPAPPAAARPGSRGPMSAAASRRNPGWGDTAGSSSLRDTLGTWRQRPGSRPVSQALWGLVSAQLVVLVGGLVPLLLALQGRLRPGDPVWEGLQDAVAVTSAACATHGYVDLAAALTALLTATPATLPSALTIFCQSLATSMFPRYSQWVLQQAAGLLLLPGASLQHGAVVQLLQALFEIPGLQLSAEARQWLCEQGLLGPLVGLTQGVHGNAALRALDAISTYLNNVPVAAGGGVASGLEGGELAAAWPPDGGASGPGRGVSAAYGTSAAAGAGGGQGAAGGVEGREVRPGGAIQQLLPQVKLVEWLQRLQQQASGSGSSNSSSRTRQKKRVLLPFLAGGVAVEGQRSTAATER